MFSLVHANEYFTITARIKQRNNI